MGESASASLTVRAGVPGGPVIKVGEGNFKSVVANECGEIAHSAGPAVSLMTSLSCGFHENQTSSHSCFHTKPSCFGDPTAFSPCSSRRPFAWQYLHDCLFFFSSSSSWYAWKAQIKQTVASQCYYRRKTVFGGQSMFIRITLSEKKRDRCISSENIVAAYVCCSSLNPLQS